MIIPLSWRQFAAARHWASERHRFYLGQAETVGQQRIVTMPFIAWRTLCRELADQAYTPWGRGRPSKLRGTPGAGTASALRTIERHLTHAETHPALRGEWWMGHCTDVMTAWRSHHPSGRPWQLTPAPGEEMVVLVPQHIDDLVTTEAGTAFRPRDGLTHWLPERPERCGPLPGLFLDPAEHSGW